MVHLLMTSLVNADPNVCVIQSFFLYFFLYFTPMVLFFTNPSGPLCQCNAFWSIALYRWDINTMGIPICVICFKKHSNPKVDRPECIAFA